MEAKTAAPAPAAPDKPLGQRLRALKPAGKEDRSDFLGRAADIAAEYPEGQALTGEDAQAVEALVPWEIYKAGYKARQYGAARRIGWTILSQRTELAKYNIPKQRYVSTESDNILLLAKDVLRIGDVQVILEIEKAVAEQISEHQSQRERKLKASGPPSRRQGRPKPEAESRPKTEPVVGPTPPQAESEAESGLVLDDIQEEITELLGLPVVQIARERGIGGKAVTQQIVKACKNNGMDKATFLAAAVEQGKIDMSLLPKGRVQNLYSLTFQELKVLREHPFDSIVDTAEALGVNQRMVSVIWRDIYVKMNLSEELYRGKRVRPSRIRAFLIGKRDGRI